ncbi:putative HNH endonuclease [Shigella phage ChubbyThor]|uniref:Putative homing endonuclease n=1 Tax=Shigella phage Ag3 TaxID=637730 RepID=C8XUE0_9CAUD|nr:homing endonuclease [Shigella phage Ag3]ACO94270.1 putative homing endonuclease [Shigella phage Ag3]UGO47014.1 putative HNH endonuclease [Shigella phage ChubbyThor]
MNYTRALFSILERSYSRNLIGYSERHHREPRSLGGSDTAENIAVLTAREHFIVHKLLAKIFSMSPAYVKIFSLMRNRSKSQTSRQYEEFALRKWERMKAANSTPEFKRKCSERFKGVALSREHRSKISDSLMDRPKSDSQRSKLKQIHSKPWESPNAKHTRKYWALAGVFYDWWVADGARLGICRNVTMAKELGVDRAEMTAKSCIQRFQKGWVPYNDENWVKFFEEMKNA